MAAKVALLQQVLIELRSLLVVVEERMARSVSSSSLQRPVMGSQQVAVVVAKSGIVEERLRSCALVEARRAQMTRQRSPVQQLVLRARPGQRFGKTARQLTELLPATTCLSGVNLPAPTG